METIQDKNGNKILESDQIIKTNNKIKLTGKIGLFDEELINIVEKYKQIRDSEIYKEIRVIVEKYIESKLQD
ncbi:MAG: hypothetical protein FWC19_06765 [Treponema sp.]|nr:hypothetical protein [Treponema sp.]MCL2272487.1 hypothetical protein [Treponema sp.]